MAMTVPIAFEWKTMGGDFRRTRGATCDLSSGGVYAYVRHPLAVALWVQFDAEFPSELTGGRPGMFRCQGPISRCENIQKLFGIGVSIKTRQLLEDRKLHRRSYSRVTPSALIRADVPEYLKTQKPVRDLHRAGAFIELSEPLPTGQEVELLLRATGLPAEMKVTAVVRRFEPAVGIGVEFVAVSEEADRLLRQIAGKSSSVL